MSPEKPKMHHCRAGGIEAGLADDCRVCNPKLLETFTNEAVPRIFIDLNALYCEACLMLPEPKLRPVKDSGRKYWDSYECQMHGKPDGARVVDGKALAGFLALVMKTA